MRTKIIAAAAACVLMHAPAKAQEPSPALALAVLCVSEASWTCFNIDDGLAIHEVVLRGAARHDVSYAQFARMYAPRQFGAKPPATPHRAWLSQLNEAGDAPPAWWRAVPWTRYRDQWLRILAKARRYVERNTLANVSEWSVCDSEVHDWGGFAARPRAVRRGLIPVKCGNSHNDFYARPRVLARRR